MPFMFAAPTGGNAGRGGAIDAESYGKALSAGDNKRVKIKFKKPGTKHSKPGNWSSDVAVGS